MSMVSKYGTNNSDLCRGAVRGGSRQLADEMKDKISAYIN